MKPKRCLVTWSDRGVDGPVPEHLTKRPSSDRGPVLRLLEQPESEGLYAHAVVLTVPQGERRTETLAAEMAAHVERVTTRTVAIDDPSDYAKLYKFLGPVVEALSKEPFEIDILVSAGTPQAQTIWVLLVASELLRARLLQVIPSAFVPHPHPRAIRTVSLAIEGFPEVLALREEVTRLRAHARVREGRLLGQSPEMHALRTQIARVAASEIPVLVVGETGTGKELVARALHESGPREKGPFVAENCGALAESLLASELFGHEANAFTGARTRHRGLFEQAHGGTLFLDEVGELPPAVQAMLLRVLEEGVVRRVGGEKSIRVDVRVIAATHRDVKAMVRAGTFREDLYYRLRGVPISVPPLRERATDVVHLLQHFVREARGHGETGARRKSPLLTPSPRALRALLTYSWPGNGRELRSEAQRLALFCDTSIALRDLSPEIREAMAPTKEVPVAVPPRAGTRLSTLAEQVEEVERLALRSALLAHEGNLLQTAKSLGIERNTLKRKLQLFGLRT